MSATLYDLVAVRDLLDAALEAGEGELTPELDAWLEDWSGDFDRKAEDYALVITEQKALAEMINAEAEKLQKRAEARLNLAKRLTARLQQAMELVGRDKVRGVLKTVSLQANSPSVQEVVPAEQEDLRNVAAMHPGFVRHIPERFEWDKAEIKFAAKAGTLPEDILRRVQVVQTRSIRIR